MPIFGGLISPFRRTSPPRRSTARSKPSKSFSISNVCSIGASMSSLLENFMTPLGTFFVVRAVSL